MGEIPETQPEGGGSDKDLSCILSSAIQPAAARVHPAPVRRLDWLRLQVGGESGEGRVRHASAFFAQQQTWVGQVTTLAIVLWRSETLGSCSTFPTIDSCEKELDESRAFRHPSGLQK